MFFAHHFGSLAPVGYRSYTFPISFSQAIDFLLLSLLFQNTLKLFHSKVKLPNFSKDNLQSDTGVSLNIIYQSS